MKILNHTLTLTQSLSATLLILFFSDPAFASLQCKTESETESFVRRVQAIPQAYIPIEHVIVLMQENHSFDHYFGRLNQPQFYGKHVSGIHDGMYNLGADGQKVFVHHEKSLCVDDPEHGWNDIHREWNDGKLDGFVRINGEKAMGYYDQRDLPFYYDLANKFAIADHYFSSTLTQTIPNRLYLYAATSFGHIANDALNVATHEHPQTFFDMLNKYRVSWGYYKDGPGYLEMFQPFGIENITKMHSIATFSRDLANDHLPRVVFIDADSIDGDEHPHSNIQVGQAFVANQIREWMRSPYWQNSVLFLTYDEGGGFYDHEPPPEACAPDEIEPALGRHSISGHFDRLGIRVPFLVVSPYAKHHFVSHQIYDHTSILKFIENKFNLPSLTARDAHANSPDEMFDYEHPDFASTPNFDLAQTPNACL